MTQLPEIVNTLKDAPRNKAKDTSARHVAYQRRNLKRIKARDKWLASVVTKVTRWRFQPHGPRRPPLRWRADARRIIAAMVAAGRRRHWYAFEMAAAVQVKTAKAERILCQLWHAGVVRGFHHKHRNVKWFRPNTYVYRGAFPPITATPANP